MCTITNLSVSDLTIVYSALSHQIIDLCRAMRTPHTTALQHNMMNKEVQELQELCNKISIIIDSRAQNCEVA